MSKDNVISAAIAPADFQAMIDAVNLIKSKLPLLISLTPEERKKMPRIYTPSESLEESLSDSEGARRQAPQQSLLPSQFNNFKINKRYLPIC